MSVGVLGWLLAGGLLVACATGGPGNDPEFGPVDEDGGGAGVTGDDASDDSSPGNPSADEGGSASGICPNDPTHELEALGAILAPKPCTSGADCTAGQCCFVGASASSCVMQ
jgi:hypothetical protein